MRRPLIRNAAWLIIVVAVPCVFLIRADDKTSAETDDQKHGVRQVLMEGLVRSRDLEMLLQGVPSRVRGDFPQSEMDALLRIFGAEHDAFRLDADRESPTSIRSEAFRRLREAARSAQRQWQQSVEPSAEAALTQSLADADGSTLSKVSRQFPMTEAGVRAGALDAVASFLRGDQQLAELKLSQLDADYSGTLLAGHLERLTVSLRSMMESRNRTRSSADRESPVLPTDSDAVPINTSHISLDMDHRRTRLSPPWPIAQWRWTESVWRFPGAPQPQAGTVLESFLPESGPSLRDFSNWRPVFWDSLIVHRTPFRLVALDPRTGEEKWSVRTDTFTDRRASESGPVDIDEDSDRGFDRYSNDVSLIAGLASYGIVSVDPEFLYFVDHFRFFNSSNSTSQRGFGGINRFGALTDDSMSADLNSHATRIVALRRSANGELPHVVWTAGDASEFCYRVVRPHRDTDEASFADGDSFRNDGTNSRSRTASSTLSAAATADRAVQRDRVEKDMESPSSARADAAGLNGPANDLSGHRFLCPPTGSGQQLFTMTVHRQVTFLNCLARHTGRLLWQQPLVFGDDWFDQFLLASNPVDNASMCFVTDDQVICSLSNGIVVSVGRTDGRLRWSTAIKEDMLPERMRGMRMPLPYDTAEAAIESPAVIVPLIHNNVLVTAGNTSGRLFGISVTTGEILWRSSRRAFGPGDVGGSPDHYIAGIHDDERGPHVVLIGERHCRSVSLLTGEQLWVLSVPRSSGRAICRSGRCLIPLLDGLVLTINLGDASVVRHRPDFAPENPSVMFGALCDHDDLLCFSTPVSLTVFPGTDVVARSLVPVRDDEEVPVISADISDDIIRRAVQAFLIDGNDRVAMNILQMAIRQSSAVESESTERVDFARYLGELLLQDWGTQLFPERETALYAGSRSGQSPTVSDRSEVNHGLLREQRLALLAELQLTPEQQLRSAVLATLDHPDVALNSEDIAELTAMAGWDSAVPLTNTWRVRPDLLLRLPSETADPELWKPASLSASARRKLASTAILFPDVISSGSKWMDLVKYLVSVDEPYAGELVAIAGSRRVQSEESRSVLQLARGGAGNSVRHRTSLRPGDQITSGLTSATTEALTVDLEPHLAMPSWNLYELRNATPVGGLADWFPWRFSLITAPGGLRELVSMDMSDGSVRDRVSLSSSFSRSAPAYRSLSNSDSTPALLPIIGVDELSMVYCGPATQARVLWSKRLKGSLGIPEVEFGPLEVSGFIWHFNGELHCTHPLTGEDLWVRKLSLSPPERPVSMVRRIFGDTEAVIVMGTDLSSFERFSMRTGERLGEGRLNTGRVADAVATGRFLLYPDQNARLHLFDGATGADLLADEEPVVVGRNNPDSTYHVLSDGRILTISSTLEIVLIDTRAGKVQFRTPAAPWIQTRIVFGLTAFERQGRLYVGLEEQRDFAFQSVDAIQRRPDPRISGGPLLCLDSETGEIVWGMPLSNTEIPQIFGDPTDLMLIWSTIQVSGTEQLQMKGHRISLQLLNSATGEILFKEPAISTARPTRCTHFASDEAIEVYTLDSRIRIRRQN